MKNVIFFILCISSITLKAQETGLYYKNGTLKYRPDLIVDSTRLGDIKIIETYYLPNLISRLNVPKYFIDNGIKSSTIVKLKIDFRNKSVDYNFTRKHYFAYNQYDSIEVSKAINDTYSTIFTHTCFSNVSDLVVYIPILFDFEKDIDIGKMLFDYSAIKIKAFAQQTCKRLD